MRKPKYFVSFGGFDLYNVSNVHDENGRDISEYDSVGAGKFNVPDARSPHTWKIECTLEEDSASEAQSWRASEIFKAMDSLLGNSTQPSRLIITNFAYPAANLSVLAWFKNYAKDETYAGVYDVTAELEEYKPVGVKTTNIPYVKRPGKVPVPKKVTIKKSSDVYNMRTKTGAGTGTDTLRDTDKTKKYGYYEEQDAKRAYLADSKTGKPVTNAATVKPGITCTINGIGYSIDNDKMAKANNALVKNIAEKVADGVKAAGNAIGKAFNGWKVKFKKNNSWAPW